METVGTPVLWGGFIALVLALLALDLGVFHRKSHEVSLKESAIWSGVWIALASLFGVGIYLKFGGQLALEYATGYLLEKALALDNIFVFVVIFASFGVPKVQQHRVLFWGIVGALLLRAGFIFAGGALVQRFHWVMYVFGAILLFTGVKLLVKRNAQEHPEQNWLVRWTAKHLPVTKDFRDNHFTVVENGKRFVTPLLLALIAIETSDVIFAIDSIPAVFAVTQDPFIVFTSNIFAILGLRSLYFLLAGVVDKFRYLKAGLASVLIFVGAKMVLTDVYKVPIVVSLIVIALVLTSSILLSMWIKPKAPDPIAKKDEGKKPGGKRLIERTN